MIQTSRVVVGGGLFGCYAALVLADLGHDVVLVEQGDRLLGRASFVNQARLHTGLHYPRSLVTASEALSYYRRFRERFPDAVRDFDQIYAVSAHNSKVTGTGFAAFVERLGVPAVEVDPGQWFHRGTVSSAFRVEEPTFDSGVLRRLVLAEIALRPAITVILGTAVTGGQCGEGSVRVELADGTAIEAQSMVLAAYAGLNSLRRGFGLAPLQLSFELTEVALGAAVAPLTNVGFTVMDGPFWSLMPFGRDGQSSLTSVGLTPLRRSKGDAEFSCQERNPACAPLHLQECTTCSARPGSAVVHQVQQMSKFLKDASAFTPTSSLFTVKAVLSATEVDDARPTVVHREPVANIVTVFSGKVSTVFDLDRELT